MKVQYHVLINYTKKQKKILKEILHLSEYNFSEPVDGHREGLLIREDITLSNLKAIVKNIKLFSNIRPTKLTTKHMYTSINYRSTP